MDTNNQTSGSDVLITVLQIIFALCQIITYPMAIIRWFMTDQPNFWRGFKELIWALMPIANIFYVWDWWTTAVIFVVSFVIFAVSSLGHAH